VPKAKPAAKRAAKPKPKAAAKPRPKAAAKPGPAAKPKPAARPKAAAPPAPPAPQAARRPIEPPTGSEILESAVQAAKDIAQVGLVVGHEALKAVRSKLPGGR
jgi:hypothetical protein